VSHPAINTPLSPRREKRRAAVRAADELICLLAQLFPAVFTGARWQPHKPLTRGVHGDLIARGILLPDECRGLFRRYCGRRAYQVALAAGGPRFDLDGQPSGEITTAEQEAAKSAIAAMDAAMIEKAAAGKAARKAERARKRAAPAAPNPPAPKPALQLVPAPADAGPKRPIGLADLKRAAQARREHADGPEPPRAA
jgi:sRNA-binding protein